MQEQNLLNIKEASRWASEYLNKNVSTSNITYLINYGRIENKGNGGNLVIDKKELESYYNSYYGKREVNWKNILGDDIDWHLSFEGIKEKETTKHVHRLHPYKGKFIPQLVEYFLDDHTDEFKQQVYFNRDDIILDPFCGSGTTLVQANELGMHAVGIDISKFNSLISNVKVQKHDLKELYKEIRRLTEKLKSFVASSNNVQFEYDLFEKLSEFNKEYFPSPEFKRKVRKKEIDEKQYGKLKEEEFKAFFYDLVKKHNISLKQKSEDNFIDKWYLPSVRNEIDFLFDEIKKLKNGDVKKILTIILSRTIRSCRATTHADLATLIDPVYETYYCSKHGKICKPLFSLLNWWNRYTADTIQRLNQFNRLRTDTHQICLSGDAKEIDLINNLEKRNSVISELVKKKKIKGIFTSPPYVGLIDYHEQHAYAYDLFGFERNDELEIGPLSKGKSKSARENYIEGISEVLRNCKKYLANDFSIFIVANDKFGMYPKIAEKSGMKIVQQFKRPVLNRTEKDKGAYSESIFLLKEG